jgi:hypothetical protein
MAGAPADTVGAAPGAIVGKVSAGFLQQAISSAILRCAARAAGDGSGGDGGDEQDAAGLGAPAALPSPAKSANESIELACAALPTPCHARSMPRSRPRADH